MEKEKKGFQKNFFEGFSKLNKKGRLKRLFNLGFLDEDDLLALNQKTLYSTELAEKFIENVIGYFQVPLGVVPHLVVDGKNFVVPMAIEETSIVAAASKTAKWVKKKGEIRTKVIGRVSIGQIQVARLKSKDAFSQLVLKEKESLIEEVNRGVAEGLVRRGGGVKDIRVRLIPRGDGQEMGVVHVHVDCCDAMGANLVNQVCESLKDRVEKLTQESVSVCILSNLSDQRLVRAELLMRDLEPETVEKIEEASLFAALDPYRACTHNKGVLNAIDALLLATGNDWRAVEAGIHAYAAGRFLGNGNEHGEQHRLRNYGPITQWREWKKNKKQGELKQDHLMRLEFSKLFNQEEEKINDTEKTTKNLIGFFEAPLSVGVVGGVTRLHPMAALSLKVLKIKTADELARVCAAIGLVQNLGALLALTTVGIIEGHMKLHIKNLTLGAGAKKKEVFYVQKKLEEILALKRSIRLSHAVEALRELRQKKAKIL